MLRIPRLKINIKRLSLRLSATTYSLDPLRYSSLYSVARFGSGHATLSVSSLRSFVSKITKRKNEELRRLIATLISFCAPRSKASSVLRTVTQGQEHYATNVQKGGASGFFHLHPGDRQLRHPIKFLNF